MKEVNIGIIAGCMICQSDLKLSQLFFRILSKELLEKDDIKCYVSLRYYNEYFRIPEKADHLAEYAKPGVIILQIRPSPFVMRSELLIQNFKGQFMINPLVFSAKNLNRIENILGTKDPVIIRPPKIKGYIKRWCIMHILKINIFLGNIFGLRSKTQKSLEAHIVYLKNLCNKNNIPLAIIGTLNSYNPKQNKLLSGMNDSLKKLSQANGITYLDIFSIIDKKKDHYFGPDKYHLNEEGHALVAGLLYKSIREKVMVKETA